ncbi:uncharacterized protein LOC112595749 [Melanaphis sacchari]|uniref:uncharacterized protein LOC112595749 n=1 Tax=Melanaphis sacchari TaxID=742174 RepID=UPI000DC14E37|nr:uncharacterized protein LOC112595749 [Melanaphis sacchari]
MCMPGNHRESKLITHAELFALTPVQPLPPTRPPYQRYRAEPRQQQLILRSPAAVAPPEDEALTVAGASKKQAPNKPRCTCHAYYAARAIQMAENRRRVATVVDILMIARLFVALAIVILATQLIVEVMHCANASGAEIGQQHSDFKRQLPPIEQGNAVIDSIFQIPINTLNAVGSLIKNVRPLMRRTRERIQQYYYGTGQQQQQQYYNRPQRDTSHQQRNCIDIDFSKLDDEAILKEIEKQPKKIVYVKKSDPKEQTIIVVDTPLEDFN